MKRTKLSRILSIVLAGAMVMGCISLNTFAEEIIGDEELVMEEAAYTEGEEISVGVEEIIAEDEVISEDAFVEEEEIIIAEEDEIVLDFSEEEVQEPATDYVEEELTTEGMEVADDELMLDMSGELDAVDADVLLGEEGAEVPEVIPTTIALNYNEYTLNSVGETFLLMATVSGTETEATVEQTEADSLVEETEAMSEEAAEEVIEETAEEEFVSDEVVLADEVTELAADATVSWSSSDENVATVDGIGMVAAVATGEAIITCTLDSDPTVVATCKVTVNADCILVEHVHSREECFVRELICSHTSDDEHTAECFSNMFVCGLEEHVHDENCFENTMISDEAAEVAEPEEFVYEG